MMYEPLKHMSPAPVFPIGVNERAMAYQCAKGDLRAGVRLADALRTKEGAVSVSRMVEVAGNAVRLTAVEFDRFADAFALSEFRNRMRAAGVEDRDEPVEQPESD